MAIKDSPINEQLQGIKDTPIKVTAPIPLKSNDRDKFEAGQIALLDNYLTGTPVVDVFDAYKDSPDKDSKLRQVAAEKFGQDRADLLEEFVDNPYGDSGDIEETADSVAIANRQLG